MYHAVSAISIACQLGPFGTLTMPISTADAATILRQEAMKAAIGPLDRRWEQRIEKLSQLCAEGISSTHIAFLGTAILAKSVSTDVDLFAIKPKHAPENPNAYSARSLCHSVLVPLAAELGINLGVTGREPLNNQPYFRMTSLGDGTPVHARGRDAFDYMLSLVQHLQAMRSVVAARTALRAFVAVRQRYLPSYLQDSSDASISPNRLLDCIQRLVATESENGSRAQAVVAGIFDVVIGFERVESGRINDPSRRHPGDVCIRSVEGGWEKAVEVRDKPVRIADVHIFAMKCVQMGVKDAAVVMASTAQENLDEVELGLWAEKYGIGLTLFYGWTVFVEQALFWAAAPKPVAALAAVSRIHARLIAVEASPAAVVQWNALVSELHEVTDAAAKSP